MIVLLPLWEKVAHAQRAPDEIALRLTHPLPQGERT
jgi:hypothetical protein